VEDSTLDALKAKHGRVVVITLRSDIEFAIRAPNKGEYRAFRAKIHNPVQAPDATEDLLRALVVWCNGEGADDPAAARKALNTVMDQYPGISENKIVNEHIGAMSGMTLTEQGKS
jgi:hypothetical protein